MAFSFDGWDKVGSAANTDVPVLWGYESSTDNLSTIATANYFMPVYEAGYGIRVGEEVYVSASDGVAIINFVTVSSIAVTTNIITYPATQTYLNYTSVAITATQFKGMYATPVELVAAPGANKLLVLDKVQLLMTYGTAAYAAGGTTAVQYDSTANGAGVIASTTLANTVFQPTVSTGFNFNAGVVAETFSTCVNKGFYLSNISAAFTTGDSAMVAHVWYKIIPTA